MEANKIAYMNASLIAGFFEKKFINIFPSFFKKYEPICVTWRGEIAEKIDSIELLDFDNFDFSSITKESEGAYVDGHLGAYGNLELFKYFAKKLKLNLVRQRSQEQFCY